MLGIDSRESTPGVKRFVVIASAEARSFKRASILLEQLADCKTSPNTIERICLDAGTDLQLVADQDWKGVLTGQSIIPEVAIVSFDCGRIRTRVPDKGPGVHFVDSGQRLNQFCGLAGVLVARLVAEVGAISGCLISDLLGCQDAYSTRWLLRLGPSFGTDSKDPRHRPLVCSGSS